MKTISKKHIYFGSAAIQYEEKKILQHTIICVSGEVITDGITAGGIILKGLFQFTQNSD